MELWTSGVKKNSSNKQLCFSTFGIHQLLNNQTANPIFKTASNISNFSIFDIPHGTVNSRCKKQFKQTTLLFYLWYPPTIEQPKCQPYFKTAGNIANFSTFDIPHGTVNIRWNKTVQTNNCFSIFGTHQLLNNQTANPIFKNRLKHAFSLSSIILLLWFWSEKFPLQGSTCDFLVPGLLGCKPLGNLHFQRRVDPNW